MRSVLSIRVASLAVAGLMIATVTAPAVGASAGGVAGPTPLPLNEVAPAEIVVDTLADTFATSDGQCSLREAIWASNNPNTIWLTPGECGAGVDGAAEHITFAVSGTISLASDLDAAANAIDLDGGNHITIDGNGHRPLTINGGVSNVRNLRITDAGGTNGGAISTPAHVFIAGITITGSSANLGGAVYVGTGGVVVIRESTLSGNHAVTAGGAVYSEGTLVVLLNATLAGNSAPAGGGLYNAAGSAELLHATISGNTGTNGGGARIAAGDLALTNSLVVGNSGANANNLVTTGATVDRLGSTVNRSGSGILDPNGLGNNGGPTKTIRLVKSSTNPALKHADAGYCLETGGVDQRGVTRPGGTVKCDDGAVELDRAAPSMSAGPKTSLRMGAALSGTSSRVLITWAGADNVGGSGIDHFTLAKSVNGGAWSTVSSSLTGTSRAATLTNASSYRFRVRAVDQDGNASAWRYGPTFTPRLTQQTGSAVTFSSGWTSVSSTRFSGGSAKYAKVDGRWVRFTFTGRSVAFVTTLRSSGGGLVNVYVDGTITGTVILSSPATVYRTQAYVKDFAGSTSHTIRIVVVGTGRVDVDAFAVLK